MRGLSERMNIMPEDGDKIGACCINCGRTYPYHVGVDKDRSMRRCSECQKAIKNVWKNSVAGSLKVSNKAVRDAIVGAIEEHTEFSVFIEERVGDIWIYRGDKK